MLCTQYSILKPGFSLAIIALFFLAEGNLSAQFSSFSFVFGQVYTPGSTSYEVPPTDIRMRLTSPGGSSSFFGGVTTYNAGAATNPYSILFTNNGSNNSAKIYVDKSTTDDDYVDLTCITVSDISYLIWYITGQMSLTAAQKVAADVNIDGMINVFDAISIQNVILGYDDKFQNSLTIDGVTHSNVSAVYPTADELAALNSATFNVPYTCVYFYNPLLTSLIGRNFAAIRLGDVNPTCDNFFTNN